MKAPDPIQVHLGPGPERGSKEWPEGNSKFDRSTRVRLGSTTATVISSGRWARSSGAYPPPGSATWAQCGPRSVLRGGSACPSYRSLPGRLPSAPARARPFGAAPAGHDRPRRWRRDADPAMVVESCLPAAAALGEECHSMPRCGACTTTASPQPVRHRLDAGLGSARGVAEFSVGSFTARGGAGG